MSNNKSGLLIVFLAVAGLSVLGPGPVFAGSRLEKEPNWKDDDFEYVSNTRIDYIIKKANFVANSSPEEYEPYARARTSLCGNGKGSGEAQFIKITYVGGDRCEGLAINDIKNGWARCIYTNGDIYDGCWRSDEENGRGMRRYADGEIYEGVWSNGERSGRGVSIGVGFLETHLYGNGTPKEIGKVSLLHDTKGLPVANSTEKRAILGTTQYGEFGLAMKHSYFSVDQKGGQKSVTVDYRNINRLLNSAKVVELDNLIENEAIVGIKHFSELKPFARELARDILYGSGLLRERGGTEVLVAYEKQRIMRTSTDESYLLLLANVKNVEELKKIRFQTIGTLGRRIVALGESYDGIKSFMESIGVVETNSLRDEYLAIVVGGLRIRHAAGAIVDVEKIKRIDPDMRERAFNGQKLLYIHDSDRLGQYKDSGSYSYFLGDLSSRVRFLNRNEQELQSLSCLFHATAAVMTAMEDPTLVNRIRNGGIVLYDQIVANGAGAYGGVFNEFELKTMLNLQKMFDNLGATWINSSAKVNVASFLVSVEDKEAVKSMCRKEKKSTLKDLVCDLAELFRGNGIDVAIGKKNKPNSSAKISWEGKNVMSKRILGGLGLFLAFLF
ncbi:MAG: hypothetical protein LBI29_03975 [Rickettsiales bacterium]|jgi:hypothetical protein|nr:hypothetical protein [Rickettsiales bacterium]